CERALDRPLGALRAGDLHARLLRRRAAAARRVLPRPRSGRASGVRRGSRAGGRRSAARPLAAGQRAPAQAPGCSSLQRAGGRGDTLSATIPKRTDTRFHGGTAAADDIDCRALAAELRAAIEGEVRFDTGSRALY